MNLQNKKKRQLARLQRFGSDFVFLIGGTLLILLIAVVVVWPLWFLATNYLNIYTLLCFILAAFAAIWFVFKKVKAYRHNRVS